MIIKLVVKIFDDKLRFKKMFFARTSIVFKRKTDKRNFSCKMFYRFIAYLKKYSFWLYKLVYQSTGKETISQYRYSNN